MGCLIGNPSRLGFGKLGHEYQPSNPIESESRENIGITWSRANLTDSRASMSFKDCSAVSPIVNLPGVC